MNGNEPRYKKLGQLDDQTVYWDQLCKKHCIERDFEILCDMREDEVHRFYATLTRHGKHLPQKD